MSTPFLKKSKKLQFVGEFAIKVSSSYAVRDKRGSDFSVWSDCLNAVKAGPCRNLLSKYAESSAVGLPVAGTWTAI